MEIDPVIGSYDTTSLVPRMPMVATGVSSFIASEPVLAIDPLITDAAPDSRVNAAEPVSVAGS